VGFILMLFWACTAHLEKSSQLLVVSMFVRSFMCVQCASHFFKGAFSDSIHQVDLHRRNVSAVKHSFSIILPGVFVMIYNVMHRL